MKIVLEFFSIFRSLLMKTHLEEREEMGKGEREIIYSHHADENELFIAYWYYWPGMKINLHSNPCDKDFL